LDSYRKDSTIRIFYSLCLIVIIGFISRAVHAVDVIAHPSVSESTLTISQLRRIYTMRQTQWPDGQRITVFVLPRHHVLHIQFSKELLEMYPYQLDRIWNKLTYSGLGVAPITVISQIELIDAVKNTPGSIGYIGKHRDEKGFYIMDIKG
jgi:ABC-type phosphate transport system substrate-binding protein